MQQTERSLDHDVETLSAGKDAWARLPVQTKMTILRTLRRNVHVISSDWAAACAEAKGLAPESALRGEEWISGPWAVLYAINRYLRTLGAIDSTGSPRLPPARLDSEGRVVLDVFPHDLYDRLLLAGVRAEVWMQQGITPRDVRLDAARFYRLPQPSGRVVLVLGAGNISSVAPLDVLYKAVAEGAVCLLKLNPVNDFLGPIFERAFAPLIENGFLRIAYGGADVGEYLCRHPAVDEIHVTGSEQTYRAIVHAAGAGKKITSELGNVSPTIVLPGPWKRSDVAFQAASVASQKAHNAGFNCIAAQVLILPEQWSGSDALREAVSGVLSHMEDRPEYYPGAAERRLRLAGAGVPARSIVELPADRPHELFETEAFCGILACVRLPGGTEEFLQRATAFANERLRGTLGANLIAHPRTLHNHRHALNRAIAGLRYGSVAVNSWTGVGYFLAETPWGAFDGGTIDERGSGSGVVHNAYLLARTEKSVVYGPFRPLVTPPWFVTNRRAVQIGRALCDFEASRSASRALAVAAAAVGG